MATHVTNKYYLLATFGILYYLAILIGLESRVENIALFWPANGVAFAFFLIRPRTEWPMYLLVLSAGYILGMHATGDYSWTIIFGALAANIIQTLFGSWLVKYFIPHPITFSSVKEIALILFFTAIAGSFASACFSVMVLGPGFMKTPFELWLSGVIDNAGSTIMTLPFVLLWVVQPAFSIRKLTLFNIAEMIALGLVTILLTEYVFSTSAHTNSLIRTLPYLLVPCVIWSAFRFSQRGATLAVLFISSEAVRHTLLAEGPFFGSDSGFILVLTLHLYISVIAITGFLFAALIQQQKLAMYALTGSIAHEVRNPLSKILYRVDKIQQYLSNPKQHDQALTSEKVIQETNKINNTVHQGLQVIDMLLNEIKAQSTSTKDFELLSAQKAVQCAIDEYAYRDNHERSKLSLEVKDNFIFKGELTSFKFVLFNLLKNALYYTNTYPESRIVITLTAASPYNKIEVKDTGPGIAKETLSRLFTEFHSSNKVSGTGLGLPYCKRTMHHFGGKIACESVEGQYTLFTLYFPSIPYKENIPSQEQEVITDNKAITNSYLNDITLILVDDEEINHIILKDALEAYRINVLSAYNAKSVFAFLEKYTCHGIIMDLNMPDASGIELTQAIRSKIPFKTLPVIGLSGDPRNETAVACQKAGMNAYLRKPLDKSELIKTLTQHLELNLAT